MICMKYFVVVATLSLVLVGCSSNNKTMNDNQSSNIYLSAQQKLKDGNYRDAIRELETLDSRDPFGPYAQQVQLDLIYAYYKSADLLLAQASISRFLQFNPTHPNIDYIFYMRGLTNMAFNNSGLQGFFGIDFSDRDPKYTRAALHDFMQLISNYPNSKYVIDATKHLIYLKERLAKHELAVVEYYTKRSAYVAVVNSVEYMLRDFPDTKATKQALPYLALAYQKLQLITQADKVAKIIAMNSIVDN